MADRDEGVINIDEDIRNADWLRYMSWSLPPYKSEEFMAFIGGAAELEHFRQLPVYEGAVARGLIVDDEWVAGGPRSWRDANPRPDAEDDNFDDEDEDDEDATTP